MNSEKLTVSEIKQALQKDPNFLLLRATDILALAEKAEAGLKPLAEAKAALEKELDELKTRAASREQDLLTVKSRLSAEIDSLEKRKAETRTSLSALHTEKDELTAGVAQSRAELEQIHGVCDLIAEAKRLTAEIDGKREISKRESERLAGIQKSLRVAELQQAKA